MFSYGNGLCGAAYDDAERYSAAQRVAYDDRGNGVSDTERIRFIYRKLPRIGADAHSKKIHNQDDGKSDDAKSDDPVIDLVKAYGIDEICKEPDPAERQQNADE